MFSIIKTATKETLFYKLPALIGDILIQVGTLLFLLYGTDMVREKNLALYERSGSWFLLVVSCIAAAWILGIKINERGRSSAKSSAGSAGWAPTTILSRWLAPTLTCCRSASS